MLLNCHTQYSFKYGTLPTELLLQEAAARGYDAVAVTDINSTCAILDFLRLAPKYGITPIAGIDFRNGAQQQYVGIARNAAGYQELNEHLITHSHAQTPFPDRAPAFHNAFIIYPYPKVPPTLRENEYLGLNLQDRNRLHQLSVPQHKWVYLQSVTFLHKQGFNAHRLLRAIANNTLLSKLPKSEEAPPSHVLPHKQELLSAWANSPQVLRNTEQLMLACSLYIDRETRKNKQTFTGDTTSDRELLLGECQKGLMYRYGPKPDCIILQRLQHELEVITQMGFISYFLINWDMVRYAHSKGYYHVGRGSGANSLVAYLLRITDVDPIELDLYFERFINPHRSSPPDFDIDFSWTDRPDVTSYLFDRYGDKHTAILGAYITFQPRSTIRELGKVFGLPSADIDALQDGRQAGKDEPLHRAVLQYAPLIVGLPSHLGLHASGIIISEAPTSTYGATMLPPKGFPTVHFSMLEAEDIGLQKFDVLGQRGLAKIKEAIEIISEQYDEQIDVHDTKKFIADPVVQNLLRQGQAIGCFYIESPAMRMLLTKLKAHNFPSLVAASSIIRPGVAQSGMMQEYIHRFQDEERRRAAQQARPTLYALLEETYGVMVYQEDVLKVAHYYGGLTLAEADSLRRGMNFKYRDRSEFTQVKEKFFHNCLEKGEELATIEDIWYQMESFASFAFAKGHSASFAVESFQALYLKAHYPLAYMTAVLNNGGGFYNTELYVHEARKQGAHIEVPHINKSDAMHRLEGNTIYLGLSLLQGIEEQTIVQILQEREAAGPFISIEDFMDRVPLKLEQLTILTRIGAFRDSSKSTKEIAWLANMHFQKGIRKKREGLLFAREEKQYVFPKLWDHEWEVAYTQMELMGFTLYNPFRLLAHPPALHLRAAHLPFKIGQTIDILGYLVNRKRTSTHKGELMYFGTWLDLDGEWLDTVHFPPVARAQPFSGQGIYRLRGKVMSEFNFITIEIEQMERLKYISLDDVYRHTAS